MLKLLLVDDEPIIRKGIRTSIDWDKYDIEIAGEASNGKDALAKAFELKPQIVITDIRMPVMDGLALASRLRNELPDTKVIILSGYEDFSYAKEALSLGVTEYLLKPVGAEELISIITKIQNDIINEQLKKDRNVSTNIVLNENFLQIKSNFVNKLMKGEFSSAEEIFDQAGLLNLDYSGSHSLAFVIGIDDYYLLTENMPDKDKELLKFSVVNIAEELLLSSLPGLVCYSEFEHLLGIINADSINEAVVKNICSDIQHCIKKYLKISISIGIGKTYANIIDISKSYSEALTALKNKIFLGKSNIIQYETQNSLKKAETVFYPFNEEKEILNYLRALNLEGINQALDNIFSRFNGGGATADSIKNICSRLIVITINCIEEMGINLQDSLGTSFNPYSEVDKLDVLEDLHNWMISFFKKSMLLLQENKTLKFKSIIKFVLQYIEENYQKDLSLTDIASMVYVTPNYLSRIFKEEMNINFVDWLNQLRIEKAKALLLETGLKTYEVADKVGYRDYKYFSYIFKKITGYTPKEFKETRRK